MRQEPIPAEDVVAALDEVLRRAEFHETPSLFERFLDWLLPDGPLVGFGELQGVLLVLFIVLFVWMLVSVFQGAARRRALAGEEFDPRAPGVDPWLRARRLRDEAERARAAGDLRLALRLLFEALIVAMDGRGDLEFRPAWTNRELVRHGRHASAASALLEELGRELEPQEFGRERITEADLARLSALLEPYLEDRGGRAA